MPRTFQRNQTVEAAPLDEDTILVDPATSKYFMLNHTSSFIWERLSTPETEENLATAISNHYQGITPTDALSDVQTALEQMLAEELVVASDDG